MKRKKSPKYTSINFCFRLFQANVSEISAPKKTLVDFFYKYLSKMIESNQQSLDDIIKPMEDTKFLETTLKFAMANLIKSNNITTYLAYAKKYNCYSKKNNEANIFLSLFLFRYAFCKLSYF